MLRKRKLYKRKKTNRYLKRKYPKRRRVPHTTLIVGAKCRDGCVLVGDRKVKTDFGVSYIDKVRRCGGMPWVVFGAAGVGTLFEEFLEKLPLKINFHTRWIQYQNERNRHRDTLEFGENSVVPNPPEIVYDFADFKRDCVELLKEMREAYSVVHAEGDMLQVLMGTSSKQLPPQLYYLDSTYCLPAEVREIVFIGEFQLGEVFRKSWDPNMTMAQTAKLAALAIRYLEKEKITEYIGVGKHKPQVWFIPNGDNPREILGRKLINLLANVDLEVEAIQKKLHSLFRS